MTDRETDCRSRRYSSVLATVRCKMRVMLILSGSSNPKLAADIAKELGSKLVKREIGQFPNGDIRTRLSDRVEGEEVIIIQSLQEPIHEHLMELLLLGDAAMRGGAKKIMAVIPWLSYSKQDKIFRSGEPLAVEVLAKIISTGSFSKIWLMDLHDPKIANYFTVPIEELTLMDEFVKLFSHKIDKNSIAVSPDTGGINRSKKFSEMLGVPLAVIKKSRDLETGAVVVHSVGEDVNGKDCYLFDDLILTGATVVEAGKSLKKMGAQSVIFCATVGLFSKGQRVLSDAKVDQIWVSDAVPLDGKPRGSVVKVLRIGSIIAGALKKWADRNQ